MNWASSKYSEFEQSLLQYILIVAPIIQSLWSLEAAHANAADIILFCLACAATLRDLFSKCPDITGIPNSLAEAVIVVLTNSTRNSLQTKYILQSLHWMQVSCLFQSVTFQVGHHWQGTHLLITSRSHLQSQCPQWTNQTPQGLLSSICPLHFPIHMLTIESGIILKICFTCN